MSTRYDGEQYGKTRDDLIGLLHTKYNVKMIIQYWPLYRSELFSDFGFGDADLPETDRFFDNMVSFPWWSEMGTQMLDDLVDRTRNALDELRNG